MGLGTLTLLGMLWAPGQAAPADVHPFNLSKMDIPITYDAAKKNDIRDLLLFVSRNQGESWEQYAVAKPDKDTFFTFTSPSDGIYWFQMVIVDKSGRRDPPDLMKTAAAALKVLIDTKSPVVAIKSLDRIGDEATVTWDIQEANPDWSKFQIDYRVADGTWLPIETRGAAAGMSKFRINQTGPLTVRIQAYDTAGNRTEMTRDLAVSANAVAAAPSSIQQSAMRVGVPADVPPPAAVATPVDFGVPVLPPDPSVGVGRPEKPFASSFVAPAVPEPAVRNDPLLPGSPLAVSPNTPNPANGIPLPPAQVINVARFDLAYDVEEKGASGVSKAEVWATRDDGKSWVKWSTTEKMDSPVTVDLATRNNPHVEGIYGLKIVLLSGAGLSKGPPVSGDAPDMRVDVDLTPPVVKIWEPIPDPSQKDTMILRWQAVDRNLANDPITLEWSEQADGPWNPIVSGDGGTAPLGSSAAVTAKRLANTGQYSWKLPANFPTHRVYVRVTARDTAGNVGEVRSPHPILVDMNKPVARIHGIIGATPTTEKR